MWEKEAEKLPQTTCDKCGRVVYLLDDVHPNWMRVCMCGRVVCVSGCTKCGKPLTEKASCKICKRVCPTCGQCGLAHCRFHGAKRPTNPRDIRRGKHYDWMPE